MGKNTCKHPFDTLFNTNITKNTSRNTTRKFHIIFFNSFKQDINILSVRYILEIFHIWKKLILSKADTLLPKRLKHITILITWIVIVFQDDG